MSERLYKSSPIASQILSQVSHARLTHTINPNISVKGWNEFLSENEELSRVVDRLDKYDLMLNNVVDDLIADILPELREAKLYHVADRLKMIIGRAARARRANLRESSGAYVTIARGW